MNLRPKTKRRLLGLLTAGLAGSGVLSVVVVIQLHRYENHRLAYRAAAMQAFGRGDYRTAADNFARYLGNDRMDSPAIFDYAVSRSKLPRADMSHLVEAKGLFNRYLEMNPGDVEAEHRLLEIYQQLRYYAETTDLSDQLLKNNRDDVPALLARLGELVRQHNYESALPVAMHIDDLTPGDVQTQDTTYELMQHLRKPPADFINRADDMLRQHPGDPRFELLRAVAAYCIGDREGTTAWLRVAASQTPPDAGFILMLAGAFDRMELWNDSRELLEKNAGAPTASPTLKASLVQRLWEMGQYDAALHLLSGLNDADPQTDADLIGLTALVQITKNPADPATKATISALQQRPDDLVAGAWTSLLWAITRGTTADPMQPIRLCQSARRSDPQNPDADFFLGRAYLRIGETEPAMQVLMQTEQMQPEWAAPYLLVARAWMQRGQITFAAHAADQAYQRDPRNSGVQLTFALAHYQLLPPTAGVDQIRPVLDFIQQLRVTEPDDAQLLGAQVDLLARSNRRQEAIDLAGASVVKPDSQKLLQLALVDAADRLGLDKLLIDRLADCQPVSPERVLDQMRADQIAGDDKAARSLLATFDAHPTPGWALGGLQARDLVNDPGAAAAWEQFADARPKDLNVQQTAARSVVVMADRSLMDRVLNRLAALTGDDAIEWKILRARWELAGADDAKNSAASMAAASMAEVARLAVTYAVPQEVWADALLKLGDTNGAAVHLRQASQLDPDDLDLSLKLARLYLQQGQFHEVSLLLGNLAQNARLTNPQRIEAAMLYRRIGDRPSAITLLQDQQPIHPGDVQRDLLLAQLHAEQGEDAPATAIYSAWTMQNNCPAEVLSSFADFWASRGSMVEARNTLGQLDTLSLPIGKRDFLLASFESRWEDPQVADAQFIRATTELPQEEPIWLAWAGMKLRDRDFSGAFSAAGEGLKQLPGSSALSAMKDRAQALVGLPADAVDADLLESLATDPTNPAGIATLQALAGSETPAEALDRVAAVAQQNPSYLPAQSIVIRQQCEAGLFDQAIERATRTMQLLPIEPEPARWLTRVYLMSRQYSPALGAAEEWRNRSLDHPHPADVAIASAQLGLHQPQAAANQISWCATEPDPAQINARENPPTKAKALELYARSLCELGRTEDAWQIMQPYATASSIWREHWLDIVSDISPDLISASQRVQQVAALLAGNNADDQLAMGQAWLTIANRFNDPAGFAKAKSLVKPITDAAPPSAQAWLLLGTIEQQQNDLPDAEQGFTAATKAAPNLAAAKNNLAEVMLLRGEDLSTARQLVNQALQQMPANSALHCTLGEIDQRQGDLNAARAQFQLAVRLNQENAQALIGLAAVQNQAGDSSGAAFTLQQAESVLQSTQPPLPPPVREELEKLRQTAKKSATSSTTAATSTVSTAR